MVDCPYLDFKASHCRGCSGFFCTAKGRKKKLSDPSMCKDEEELVECPRYLSTLSLVERNVLAKSVSPQELVKAHLKASITRERCPYIGPMPDGGCCGNWCYAVDVYLKLAHKTCRTWLGCKRYMKGFENKVKFYGDE